MKFNGDKLKLDLEFFIRIAFGLKNNNGKIIQRGTDPANLANNIFFNEKHVQDVIIITGYAMEILNQDIKNRTVVISHDINFILENYINRILKVVTIKDIEDIINNYKTEVFQRFFKYDGNILSRK